MTEVKELDVDLTDVLRNQDNLYKEQEKVGMALNQDEVEVSRENLSADLKARREIQAEDMENKEDDIHSAPEGPTASDISAIDQLKDREPEKLEQPERSPQDILKELGLKEDPKKRKFEDASGNEREYIQKPLSFLGKIQFLSYVGEVLDKAMSGQNALQLGSLFEVPDYRSSTLSAQDFSDAQTFVQAVGKILVYAPDFLTKSYAIWLRVPEYEREWFADAMEDSLSDDEGLDIIETFIDQNWETLQSFFSERLPKIRDRLSARYRVSQSEQSKR